MYSVWISQQLTIFRWKLHSAFPADIKYCLCTLRHGSVTNLNLELSIPVLVSYHMMVLVTSQNVLEW